MNKCTNCGITMDPSWRFCGECGTSAPAPAAVGVAIGSGNGSSAGPHATTGSNGHSAPRATASMPSDWAAVAKRPSRSRNRISRQQIIIGVSILLAVFLVAAGVAVHLSVRHQLAVTRSDLTTTTSNLKNTQATLNATKTDLTNMTLERDDLKSQVQTLNNKIDGLTGSLSDARDQVNLASSQITILKSCLGGVSIALNDVLHNNYYGAAAALQAVQGPCQQASAML